MWVVLSVSHRHRERMRDGRRPEVCVTMIDRDVTFAESVQRYCARLVPEIVVARTTDIAGLRERVEWSRPDVVTFDPAQLEDAAASVLVIRGLPTKPAVVALTMTTDSTVAAELAIAGVLGWVGKYEPIETLVDAIHTVYRGSARYPVEHLGAVMRALGERSRAAQPAVPCVGRTLSRREQQVLAHLLSGATPREIAHRLHLSENTVRSHRRRIEAKLGVHS